jgi:hypothetical protein
LGGAFDDANHIIELPIAGARPVTLVAGGPAWPAASWPQPCRRADEPMTIPPMARRRPPGDSRLAARGRRRQGRKSRRADDFGQTELTAGHGGFGCGGAAGLDGGNAPDSDRDGGEGGTR